MRKESEADIADIFNEALLMSYITMGFDQLDFREFELWAPTYKFILVRGQTRQVYLQYLIVSAPTSMYVQEHLPQAQMGCDAIQMAQLLASHFQDPYPAS